MKYDILKCNNLMFRYKEHHGFVKVLNGRIVFVSDRDEITYNGKLTKAVIGNYFSPENFEANIDEDDFEIIPRDPDTYSDWLEGDRVCMRIIEDNEKSDTTVYDVAARINNVVILANSWGVQKVATCEELSRLGAKLVLTDYELELKGEKNPDFRFKCGDKVLVRDKGARWQFGIFLKYDDLKLGYTYILGTNECFEECIPYNESTWHLLGTDDDYKPE